MGGSAARGTAARGAVVLGAQEWLLADQMAGGVPLAGHPPPPLGAAPPARRTRSYKAVPNPAGIM